MASTISQYYGEIRKCTCGLADLGDKPRQSFRACPICFDRGFVAECLACNGKGQCIATVNGADPSLGTMKSTCNACGGQGSFAVRRPEDWVDAVPAAPELPAETVQP